MGYYKDVYAYRLCSWDGVGWLGEEIWLIKVYVVITTLDNWNNTKCNNNAIYN